LKGARQSPFITRGRIFAVAFFSLFLFLLYQMVKILSPFSTALIWAAILALAFSPLQARVTGLTRGRRSVAAGIMTAAVLFFVIGPAIMLLGALTTQALGLYEWASELIRSGRLAETWSRFSHPVEKFLALPPLAGLDIKALLVKGLGEFSGGIASQIGGILKNTVLLVINLAIVLISLFFFFRDGESYARFALNILPFTHDQKRDLSRKALDTFQAVLSGVFLIAIVQGAITGVGFALFNVPYAVLWGFLAALLALLPVGGAALVWAPGALYLYLAGSTLQAVLLAFWGAILVSLPDNFLKPLLIGKKAKIPSFFLFLVILGGLRVYGFLGILFGPLVVTLLTTFIHIYREEYGKTNETGE
jgi:predicted PurR-regulated permease PerM